MQHTTLLPWRASFSRGFQELLRGDDLLRVHGYYRRPFIVGQKRDHVTTLSSASFPVVIM